MHLLIPYVIKKTHLDPVFDEFTYGDSSRRAPKLKRDLNRGDYIFFHATFNHQKLITAYYVVDRVLDTVAACKDRAIVMKYRNPHILECLAGVRPIDGEDDDILVFGDPIRSYIFQMPLPFDEQLAEKLSLHIKFPPNRSEAQAICSATRAWRKLTDRDVEILLNAIVIEQKRVSSVCP
jgi:hypothetical protein